MIPKIIHYCWLSGDEYPKDIKKCISSWKKMMPDWEFRLWDKECLKEIDEVWVHEAYQAKVYAHASDYIRLYAVYKFGGFYLDTDVEVIKDFSPLLKYRYVFGMENCNRYIEAATFGAEAGNLYIKRCMDFYHNKHFINEDKTNNISIIIPKVMLDIFGDFSIINDISLLDQTSDRIQVLSHEFFSPKSNTNYSLTCLTDNTFSIHQFKNAWVKPTTKIARKIYFQMGSVWYKYALSAWKIWLRLRGKKVY